MAKVKTQAELDAEAVLAPFGYNNKTGLPRSRPKSENPGRYTNTNPAFKGITVADDAPYITEEAYEKECHELQKQEDAIRLRKKTLDVLLSRTRARDKAARALDSLDPKAKHELVKMQAVSGTTKANSPQ